MIQTTRFSFVIPTFNRAALVSESISSAIDWLGDKQDGEIIIVDDCSTDGTVKALQRDFRREIEIGLLRIVPLAVNGGVIKAKNAGAREARGQWLIFLDSDDLMIAVAAEPMRQAFAAFEHAPALFFRCENLATQELLGAPQETPVEYTLRDHLKAVSYGSPYAECLPAIRRDVFERFPYDESLDGLEGITYARMIRATGLFIVLPIVARRYRVEGEDRLSSAAGIRRRSRSLARGHWLVLREFGFGLTVLQWIREAVKVIFYSLRAAMA